jgi:hypothetical protein
MAKSDDQKALEAKIDAGIAETQRLLHDRHDRRGPVRAHEPENRGGFDRRAKVQPAKD